jgi:hypothetical protein
MYIHPGTVLQLRAILCYLGKAVKAHLDMQERHTSLYCKAQRAGFAFPSTSCAHQWKRRSEPEICKRSRAAFGDNAIDSYHIWACHCTQ